MQKYNEYLRDFERFVPLTDNQKSLLDCALNIAFLDGEKKGISTAETYIS